MADTQTNGSRYTNTSHATKPRSGKRKAIAQILEMQDVMHNLVTSMDARPLELASCARAWADLENRKRELKGQPLPGAYKPAAPPERKRKSEVTVSES